MIVDIHPAVFHHELGYGRVSDEGKLLGNGLIGDER
jgi:hypothetical protein